MATGPAIAARALRRSFRQRFALRDLTFEVPAGSVCGLLGRNGAGKTTLIRILCGLLPASGGQAFVLGHDVVRERGTIAGRLAAVFDPPRFYPYLSASRNLAVVSRSMGYTPPPDEVSAVLTTVGLQGIGRPVRTFSSGMVRRLGLAAALIGNPQVLILDEPMNGLDPAGIEEFRGIVRAVAARGATVLLSSHQLSEIEQLCDHAVIIADGETVIEGPLPALLGKPRYRIETSAPERAGVVLAGSDCERRPDDPHCIYVTAPSLAPSLQALVHAGIEIRHVEPVGRRLETMFLHETRERRATVEQV